MRQVGFGIPIVIILGGAIFWLLTSTGGVALALDPKKAITLYTHDLWQAEHGLPQNAIRAIVQTRDGYLWLGTEEGLVRFDGKRFVVFDKENTEAIRSNYVQALWEDRAGSLWIGTHGGLTRLKDGTFSVLTTQDGLPNDIVRAIYEDRAGNLWIGTSEGLTRWKEGKLSTYTTSDGLTHNTVYAICEDQIGSLWIGTHGGLNRLKDGIFTRFTTKDGLSHNMVRALYADRDGSLWIGTFGGGLNQLRDERFASFTTKQGLSNNNVWSIWEDRAGNLWIGTDSGGLNRLADGRLTAYMTGQGLSNDTVVSLYEDREGSLWVGTAGGLNRLKDEKVTAYTTAHGLSHDVVRSIYEDRAGNLWIGTYGGGLSRLREGRFTNFTTKDGLPNDTIFSIWEDRAGSLWVGTGGGGLGRWRPGRFTAYTMKQGLSNDIVRALYEDRAGNLWVGTLGGGLNRFKDGAFTHYTTKDGLASDMVLSISEDRAGNLWIGTFGGGLSRLKDGRLTTYTTEDGLSDDTVFSLYEDHDGALWIGTNGGLMRFKDGRFSVITTKHGLYNDTVLQILDDDRGRLWMSCNKGIYSVSKQDLNDVADGRAPSLKSIAYGTADGMRSRECNGGNQPAGWKSRDGRLWFPTIRGVVVIDPARLRINTIPPPVIVEEAIINRASIRIAQGVELPPGKGELEFHYTGLSLLLPELVTFKYRLEGFDEEWIAAGTRREAYYTNIPPGQYRFRVIAANSDGVWNETGASFEFYLQPHFYQTGWFYVLGALTVVLLGYSFLLLRVRQLKAREDELARLVRDRTKDLLDVTRNLEEANRRQADFVSGVSHELKTPLTLIRLYGETLLYDRQASDEERRQSYEIITRESERLTHLIEKVLDFSRIDRGQKQYNLGEGNLAPVVTRTVQVYGQYLARQGFSVESDLTTHLPPIKFDADAVAEAVLNLMDNAAKYSGESRQIGVRLHPEDGKIVFEVEDHGIGIPETEREKIFEQFYRVRNGTGKGGYGLGLFLVKHIMDAHGGVIEVESEIGRGSRFRLIFPAPRTDEG